MRRWHTELSDEPVYVRSFYYFSSSGINYSQSFCNSSLHSHADAFMWILYTFFVRSFVPQYASLLNGHQQAYEPFILFRELS